MNPGGKGNQQRSSWWSASETRTGWMGSVRQKLARNKAGSRNPKAAIGVTHPRKKGV